jgi:hypothetical protein
VSVITAELFEAVRPYVPAGGAWTHLGGYLGRSVVLQCGEVVLKCFLHAAQSKWQRERSAYAFLEGSGLPVPRLLAHGQLRDSVPWILLHIGLIVLDAATWAQERDPGYFEQLLDQVERLHADLDTLPACFPRS